VPAPDNPLDVLYFSGCGLSLGSGDIVPTGPDRLDAMTVANSGLMRIAWTAAFTFVQVQGSWRPR